MNIPMPTLGQWLNLLGMALAVTGALLYLYARSNQRAQMLARLRAEVARKGSQLADTVNKSQAPRGWRDRLTAMLYHLGSAVPIFSPAQQKEVRQKLVRSGIRNIKAPLIVSAFSVLCAAGMVAAAILLLWPSLEDQPIALKLIVGVMALYLGLLLPRLVLDRLAASRRAQIQDSLPDALDLLVICTNAGLSMGMALHRVASEMADTAPALADELTLTASEMQISGDVEQVLNNLAERTNLPAMRSMVSTLTNALQFGTSIVQALRVLARSERTARMMRLEEQAAKLAVKITFPMMLFIMPTIIIIAVGPAILNMGKLLKGIL
ncbi:type II secretion system F family protein [uncultured Castellaniella sp.]|uniref:type II secretion system F family protein n=1 Tax=uncultured Castellaniella sp. TaxID=647907 RepID=UPI0026202B2B|nr:type II secretion system F family protein [uncultured Castellaniella sp.]